MDDNLTNFSCRDNRSLLSSSTLTDRDFWRIGSEREIGATIAGILILIFFVVGTLWNLFIIITYLCKRDLLNEPGNILLFNAAIIDLLICVTTMVFTYVTAFGKEFVFGYSDISRCAICSMSGFFLMFLILVSLHLLSALSVDRFILLSRPLRYKRIMNRSKVMVICVVVYIISFILALLPLVGFGELEFNPRFASCVPRFTPTKNLYYVVILAGESLMPIFILAITNVWTYRIVSKFLKRNYRRRSTYRKRDNQNSKDTEEIAKYQKQQNQLVKVFGALFIANIVSYTPTITTIFIFAFLSIIGKDDSLPSEVYILGFVSFLMNPVLHPIIESFFVKDLRYQVKRAEKGIRRVSTIVYRQTTQILNSDLDEANRKMDEMEKRKKGTLINNSTSETSNLINGKVVTANNMAASSLTDLSHTEMESLQNSFSESPHHEMIEVHPLNCTTNMTKDDVVESTEDTSKGGKSPDPPKDGRMLRKERRSVTFQETSFGEIVVPPKKVATPPTSRTSNFHSTVESCVRTNPIILEEESGSEEVEDKDSLSEARTSSRSPLPV